jgi:hypothetical protein
MAQTATTGNLENASKIIIAAARYTEEHNAPAMALIESFSLPKGAKQVTVPKVGQMTVSDLQDGRDIVDEEEIGMTTVDLTASEVGAKVILTDKLVREQQNNVFTMIGKQLGDAMARKKDTDVHALYATLGASLPVTALGQANAIMNMSNVVGAISYAKAQKFGNQVYMLHHPNAVADLASEAASISTELTSGWSVDLLKNFYSGIKPINGVAIFEDGNLSTDSNGDAVGVIADKSALAVLNSVETRTERQRDASMRATEVVITSDYGVFELDDSKGVSVEYDANILTHNATS